MAAKKNPETILATDDVTLADLVLRALEAKFKGASFLLGRNRSSGDYVVQCEKTGKHDPADLIMYAEGYCDGLEAEGGPAGGGAGDDGEGDDDGEDEIEVIDTRTGKKAGGYRKR